MPPDLSHPMVAQWPWHYETYHSGLQPVLPAVQAFCSAILHHQEPRRWLSLLGPSGVGKTHVLKQALDCVRRHWRIKTTTGWRGPTAAHIIPAQDLGDWKAAQDYARHDLIFIEDIGAGADLSKGPGAVTRSRIAELLQLRSNRWTMLDANLYRGACSGQCPPGRCTCPNIVNVFDGRIASRLKRDGSWLIEIPSEVPDFWG